VNTDDDATLASTRDARDRDRAATTR
jgi:hypothetical protein